MEIRTVAFCHVKKGAKVLNSKHQNCTSKQMSCETKYFIIKAITLVPALSQRADTC